MPEGSQERRREGVPGLDRPDGPGGRAAVAEREDAPPRAPTGRPPRVERRGGLVGVLRRVGERSSQDNVSIVAAGVGFYALLALAPALAALVAVYGLVASPDHVEAQVEALEGVVPQAALAVVESQLRRIVAQTGAGLSLTVIGGLLVTLWSATRGVKALLIALDIVHRVPERRGVLAFNAQALLFTLGGLFLGVLAIGLVAVLPPVLDLLGVEGLVPLLRWPILLVAALVGLTALYRYGPSEPSVRWRFLTAGSALALALWLVGSALFSFYVSNFGSYNEVYGSLGAVVILLLWFYLTAYAVLLGAELDVVIGREAGSSGQDGGGAASGRAEGAGAARVERAPRVPR